MDATGILWRAIGCPAPFENDDGSLIKPRGDTGPCAHCGEPGQWRIRDAISDNFTTVKNASRAWPHGGDALCAACVVACKWMGWRAGLFFARVDGVWFVPLRPLPGCPETRPDALSALLSPPEPPFVAGLPLYGIDHGTEANAGRVIWPGSPVPADPLSRCQSKHTAIYARVSYSRERYPLQVDDTGEVVVDVPLWRRQIAAAREVLTVLRADGVGAEDARTSLLTLTPPPRASATVLMRWRSMTATFQPHHASSWWELVVSLLDMPALTEKPKPNHKVKNEPPAPVRPADPPAQPQVVPTVAQLSLAIDRPRD